MYFFYETEGLFHYRMKEGVNFSEVWQFFNVCLLDLWRQTCSLCLCFIISLLPVPGGTVCSLIVYSGGNVVPQTVLVIMKCGWAHSACSSWCYTSFCSPSGNVVITGCVCVGEMPSQRALWDADMELAVLPNEGAVRCGCRSSLEYSQFCYQTCRTQRATA